MARYKKPLWVSGNNPRWENPEKLARKDCKTCRGKGMIWVWTGQRGGYDQQDHGCAKLHDRDGAALTDGAPGAQGGTLMAIKEGDLVICRSARTEDARKKPYRVDGFVLDALGKKHVALSDPDTGKGCGTLKLGQVKLVRSR